MGRQDDWFPPTMESIASKGTHIGDAAQGIHQESEMYDNWGSFIRAVC